jgi:hypothetical protein
MITLTIFTRGLVAAAAGVFVAMSAHAGPALTSWTGGIQATAGGDQLYGWAFTVNSSVAATALGVFDSGSDGLSIAHDVGLYRTSDESLIASATVGAGTVGTFDAGFRYAELGTGVLLTPGDYLILMTMPALNADTQFILASDPITAPQISYTHSVFDAGSSLRFPDPAYNGSYAAGMFGPNLEISAVPEPGTWTLILAGLGALAFTTRRRQTARR